MFRMQKRMCGAGSQQNYLRFQFSNLLKIIHGEFCKACNLPVLNQHLWHYNQIIYVTLFVYLNIVFTVSGDQVVIFSCG